MRRVPFLLLLASVAWAAPAPSPTVEESVRAIIAQRHPVDTPEMWRGLGPRAPGVMIGMYQATDSTFERMRLLQGLSWFDDPTALAFVRKQAEDTQEDVVRSTAVRALGESRGAAELDFLSKFLKHADPHTRVAAAEALRRIGEPRSRAAYDRFLSEEKLPWVVATLRKAEATIPSPALAAPAAKDAAAFRGEWKGLWVQLERASGKFSSRPVTAKLSSVAGMSLNLEGEIKGKGPKSPSLKFISTQARGSHLWGTLSGFAPAGAPVAERDASYEAELAAGSGRPDVLFLRIPGLGISFTATHHRSE